MTGGGGAAAAAAAWLKTVGAPAGCACVLLPCAAALFCTACAALRCSPWPPRRRRPRRAAELKYGTLMELQKQLRGAEEALKERAGGSRLLKEEVTEADIAEIISKWTGAGAAGGGGLAL